MDNLRYLYITKSCCKDSQIFTTISSFLRKPLYTKFSYARGTRDRIFTDRAEWPKESHSYSRQSKENCLKMRSQHFRITIIVTAALMLQLMVLSVFQNACTFSDISTTCTFISVFCTSSLLLSVCSSHTMKQRSTNKNAEHHLIERNLRTAS